MKIKNPLYVVKGKDVHEASSVFDLMLKKLNLEPVINVLKNILMLLLEVVENFAMFQTVKSFFDELINKVQDYGKRFGLLSV
jgi:hypothetical protein